MIYLLDTQLLLWSMYEQHRLTQKAVRFLADSKHEFVFSTASVWEVAIKAAKHPETFVADPRVFRDALLRLGYKELLLTSEHVISTASLAMVHRDPFDRILVAQALVEKLLLATADHTLLQYGQSILYVG